MTSEPGPTTSLEALLEVSRSVAYARFARDGRLVRANPRFRSLFAGPIDDARLPALVVEAQRDELSGILGGGDLPDEARNVHFAAGGVVPTTLLATWTWDGDQLVLFGEAPVDDLEAAQTTLVRLNGRVSDLARENAKRSAELERALDDLRESEENLQALVRERTSRLEATDDELGDFLYSASHDLRAPLRAIDGFSQMVVDDAGARLTEDDVAHLQRVRAAAQHMGLLIDELVGLSRATRGELVPQDVDLSVVASGILEELRRTDPERTVEAVVAPGLHAEADAGALRAVLVCLLMNAWKFTAEHETARIEVGVTDTGAGRAFFVRDDGAGFDAAYAAHLFGAFQRMHERGRFEGSGIGLATVKRLIARHGGTVWAEAEVEGGATFFFTLPGKARPLPETTMDAFLLDNHDAILAAVQARMRGDEAMGRLAAQRELSEGELSSQVLDFWLQGIRSDLTLGCTVTMRQNVEWLVGFRAGHHLPFDDVMVRRMFDDLSREIEARLESEQLQAEYAAYRLEVTGLIAEAFPG